MARMVGTRAVHCEHTCVGRICNAPNRRAPTEMDLTELKEGQDVQLLQGENHLALADLSRAIDRPELFAAGCEPFWDDPHISRQMLRAHLDQETGAASRNPEVVGAEVEHLSDFLNLRDETRVLDLGCGPGLYAERFARGGCSVTGIDCSRNSIRYARGRSQRLGLDIEYELGDFCDLDARCAFDAVLIIYGQLGALVDEDRDRLLKAVHRALRPGGHLVFDVTTGRCRESCDGDRSWAVVPGEGFWRPHPHLVLEATFHYPEADVYLDQHAVLEENGQVSVYRIWEHYYSERTISELLREHGFTVQSTWSDLAGRPNCESSRWLAVAARRGQGEGVAGASRL